ncbi:MAG: hypothetical protein PHD95_07140 [Candidatus ainarchaeum sp.]|nr:hypothetical protein [Candidatus ainarchaeum sp.]
MAELICIGVMHHPANIAETKRAIDDLASQGIKSIGLERGGASILPAIRRFLKKKNINPVFARDLQQFLELAHFNSKLAFFDPIFQYAKEKGLTVRTIEGEIGREADTRFALEKLNKKWSSRWSAKLRKSKGTQQNSDQFAANFYKLFKKELLYRFPANYIPINLRTRQMVSQIKRHEVEAVIVGATHAIGIAKRLHIPLTNVRLIGPIKLRQIVWETIRVEAQNVLARRISKIANRIKRKFK